MEETIITHKDLKWICGVCDTNEEAAEVVDYLKEYKQVIKKMPTFDSQSGWTGAHIYLDGVDLSGNGFCFSKGSLMKHVRSYRKNLSIKQTDEYKNYLVLHEKFKNV